MIDESFWYAVNTRSRHEKQVAALLQGRGIETYLPLHCRAPWEQCRRDTAELPALPGYLFIRCVLLPEIRAFVKAASGVAGLVEHAGRPAKIPVWQIDSLRRALSDPDARSHLSRPVVGERVRICSGPLQGVEGQLLRQENGGHRVVVAVDYVNQALSVAVDVSLVERADE